MKSHSTPTIRGRRTWSTRVLIAACLLTFFAAIGCGGGDGTTPPPNPAAGSDWDQMSWDEGSWA